MKKIIAKTVYFIIGLGALIWFLIRVIPKPVRATYPCQRAAFPIASGFVLYLIALFSSAFVLKKLKLQVSRGKNLAAAVSVTVLIISGFFLLQSDKPFTYADYKNNLEGPNEPMGTGKGIFPGRVVWVHDSAAVTHNITNSTGDYWWQDDNIRQLSVNKMVSEAIQTLTGKQSDSAAWDAIFRYYNNTHGKGDVGYSAGEKIVIKLNLNTGTSGSSYSRSDNRTIDTSPQIVCAVLDQLANHAGVAQADIGFGDPGRNVDNIFWNKFHSQFPDVKYWGNGNGRTPITNSNSKVFFSSDGKLNHYLPKCYVDAAYMINIPVFKQHHRAGVSLGAKNHIGTFVPFTPDWSVRDSLHHSFPSSMGDGVVDKGDYHQYRLFVDFMGHKDLGGKTILYLVDGLWSSTNYGDPPYKWRMAPFNGSYPASIFASLDPVAIESVGFDFLYTEFYPGNPSGNAFPHYSGVDDYMHQAADSVNWPENIKYDPEGDSVFLPGSMGVHEHWNNSADKEYSRNLGLDEGIELIHIGDSLSVDVKSGDNIPAGFILSQNYPNPFNPVTAIIYRLYKPANVNLSVYNAAGQEVRSLVDQYKNAGTYKIQWNAKNNSGVLLPSGVYFFRIKAGEYSETKKMVLMK
jgi:uncharacterized protein (DUF362 family)